MRSAIQAAIVVLALVAAFPGTPSRAATLAVEITVDCAKPAGTIRALHGVNNGPLDGGGTVDVSAEHRALALPIVRLHDAHWPNPDVVDLSAVFPNPAADPSDPASYDFVRTDAYLKPIVAAGSQVVYRLGESIVHDPDRRRVRPPADPERWAAVCVGVVRHYNDGWADGHRHGIKYWEIWNEPDNRPAQWTGTDDEYFRLYATAAQTIKARFPDVKVGGPGVGNVGSLEGSGALKPPPFVERFLDFCRRESVPLDFFSWHLYTPDPAMPAAYARGVRRLLDDRGFAATESHLNEWNYLPDGDWSPVLVRGQGVARERFYDRIGGPEGAAFAASALIRLQDAPLDAGCYYAGDTNPFGLFTRHAVPRKNYHALWAFKQLTETPGRVAATVRGDDRSAWTACAGAAANGRSVHVLVAHLPRAAAAVATAGGGGAAAVAARMSVAGVPWTGPTRTEVWTLDATRDLAAGPAEIHPGGAVRLDVAVDGPAVLLVRLTPATP